METILSVALGLGLSAACGFRVFVPLLVLGVSQHLGWVSVGPGWEWLGGTPTLVVLSVATALEIGAYFIPWLDNLLDTLAGPAAVVAGAVASAALIVEMDPLLHWSVAIIGGGSAAGATQAATTLIRGASTGTTGGVLNPVVASAEAATAMTLSLTAILAPFLTVIAVGLFLILVAVLVSRRRKRRIRP